ncbi:MAG: preprotein translocase subunit SecG [Alphaproteobacteria bacterium]
MNSVILVIHLFLALAIIGLVLLQRSEGGGLGIGGGSGGLGGLASPEGTANLLTRATALCAAGFFCTSLILGVLAGRSTQGVGLMEALENAPAAIEAPVEVPAETPKEPPSVPLAE